MHLVLVISSLQSGGAERVVATMANALSDKMQVTICTLSKQPSFYHISSKVNVVELDLFRQPSSLLGAVKSNIQRIKDIRRTMKQLQPSILVSFMLETNVLVQFASLGLKLPVIICEHTDPRYIQHKAGWRLLRRLTYRSADRVVVLNDYMQKWFARFVTEQKVIVIPNPIHLEFDEKFRIPIVSPYILAAGRLVATKRFNKLIELFSKIATDYPQWQLVIAGDGELKTALQQQINNLGLQEQVHLIGNSQNLHDWMQQASIFVSTSELEAFPMVICEAMLCETPVVISAYNDGAYKLVDESAGIVTKEADATWLKGLTRLISDSKLRNEMSKQAALSAQPYLQMNVMHEWEMLFKELGLLVSPKSKI